MKNILSLIALAALLSECTPTSQRINRIQHSEKHISGHQAFPEVIAFPNTIQLGQPLKATAILNANMFKEIADYDNLKLTYKISVSPHLIWKHGATIESADTMDFELNFNNFKSDSVYIWQFMATASFQKDGKFFGDTTTVNQHRVFIMD